jgi:PAS domain S-box-containing protein
MTSSIHPLFERLQSAVIVTDLEDRVEFWNPAAERIYGWKTAETLGKKLDDFLPLHFTNPEDDSASARQTLLTAGFWQGNVIQPHKNGHLLHVALEAYLLQDTQKIVLLARDITAEARQAQALRRLQTLSRAVARRAALEEIFDIFTAETRSLFPAESLTLALVSPGAETFTPRVLFDTLPGKSETASEYPLKDSLIGVVAQTRRPLILPDIRLRKQTNLEDFHRRGIQSLMVLPLRAGDQFLGAVTFYSRAAHACSPETAEELAPFTEQLAIALHQAQIDQARRETQHRLREISLQLLRSQEDERARLARELHDEIGQMLTALKLDLRSLLDSPDLAGFSDVSTLREDLEIVSNLLERVRNLSLDLHPHMLDDLGLVATLRWNLSRLAERGNWQIHFHAAEPLGEIPPDVALTFYRISQEALTNILRHARAQNVWLEISRQEGCLKLSVRDDGIGFSPDSAQNHLGLRAMRERAHLLGAHLDPQTAPAKGTAITLTWKPS